MKKSLQLDFLPTIKKIEGKKNLVVLHWTGKKKK